MRWFAELSRVRGASQFGPARIDYLDILAWSVLTGAAPNAFEVDCLLRLDDEFHAAFAEKQ